MVQDWEQRKEDGENSWANIMRVRGEERRGELRCLQKDAHAATCQNCLNEASKSWRETTDSDSMCILVQRSLSVVAIETLIYHVFNSALLLVNVFCCDVYFLPLFMREAFAQMDAKTDKQCNHYVNIVF